MHRGDVVVPSWSSQHSGTSGSWQTLGLVLSEFPSESDFIGLLSDTSLFQPRFEQPGLLKETSEIEEGIHRASGNME